MGKDVSKEEKKEIKEKVKKEKKAIDKKAAKELKKKEKQITNEVVEKKAKPKKSIWKKIKVTFIIMLIIAAIGGIFLAFVNLVMPVKQTKKTIYFSDIKDHCKNLDNCSITDLLFENVSYLKLLDIELKDVNFDIDEDEYELVVWAYGTFDNLKEYKFTFEVEDDEGPYIVKEESCVYYIGDKFDINKCLKVHDYSDGTIKLKESNVDFNGVDLTKVGKGKIHVKVTDEDDNESEFEINLKVRNIPISDFTLSKLNSKTVEEKKSVAWKYTIKPDNIEDKSVTWSSEDEDIATVDQEGNITGVKKGTTSICATSNYDKDKKVCNDIEVTVECKNSYTFTFASNEEGKITAGEDICPGSYKFYADSVADKYSWYYLYVYKTANSSSTSYTIEKDSSYWNDEGKVISLDKDGYISLNKGILKFRLEKQG